MSTPHPTAGQAACPVSGTPATTARLYGPGLDGDAMPALYEALRGAHGPVAPVSVAPGIDAWLVLGHRELLRLTREEQDFSHDPRRWVAARGPGA